MLVPAAPGEAPQGLGYTGNPVFNRMWTLLGTPCVSLPAIWGDSGLPTGVQLVGRIGDDARLMAAGAVPRTRPGRGGMSRPRPPLAADRGGGSGGCGALDPYPDLCRRRPPAASPPGSGSGSATTAFDSSPARCRPQAQRECPANTAAEPVDSDWYMQYLPAAAAVPRHLCVRAKK